MTVVWLWEKKPLSMSWGGQEQKWTNSDQQGQGVGVVPGQPIPHSLRHGGAAGWQSGAGPALWAAASAAPWAPRCPVPLHSSKCQASPLAQRPVLTVSLHFLLLKLFQKTVRSPLWVRARHGLPEIGQQPVQAGEVRGLPEVLGTLVKPGPQDGRDGTVGTEAVSLHQRGGDAGPGPWKALVKHLGQWVAGHNSTPGAETGERGRALAATLK